LIKSEANTLKLSSRKALSRAAYKRDKNKKSVYEVIGEDNV
jgi:hypothetical protein